MFAFAGLWERWTAPDGGELATCCILTTGANELVRPVHDRMPLILRPEHEVLWLDARVTDPTALTPVFDPYPACEMTVYRVSSRVKDPRNDDELTRPVA